jgi:hypothetical protein
VLTGKGLLVLCVVGLLANVASAAERFRTVLVIDASSSMRKTDPRGLRKIAAELFVDLARDGDSIAVAEFDESARDTSGGFVRIDGIAARDKLKQAIRGVGDAGSWTNFTAGLREAQRLLAADGANKGGQDLVVFLTDGKCEPGPKVPEAQCLAAVFDEVVPGLRGVRVYPIGLSKAAPRDFLEELGRRTGGIGAVALDAKQLPVLFANVYARLLGSRLAEGTLTEKASFKVYDGAESLDLVVMGKERKTGQLVDPSGRATPIDNAKPDRYYFVAATEYRFYKIAKPAAGTWTLEVEPGAERSFASLQHFDLDLAMVDAPGVLEMGQKARLRARLASPGGAVPPADFLDRHRLFAVMTVDGREVRADMARQGDGWQVEQAMDKQGAVPIRFILEPAADGVLWRESGVLATVQVVPPVRLKLTATAARSIKQGTSGPVELDLTGSEIGTDLELQLAAAGYTITPTTVKLPRQGSRKLDITIQVPRDGATGVVRIPITAKPTLAGFEDRTVTTQLELTIVPLTFWERHGTKLLVGAGGLVLLLLLLGILSPATFARRTVLHYIDVRDPDLERKSSYPLGAKAKRGFYRPARVHIGPSGPVKKGGTVVLTAVSGNRVVARPLSSAARVVRAPGEDEPAADDRPAIPLKDGAFTMSAGTRYEIEGSGLRFWFETK